MPNAQYILLKNLFPLALMGGLAYQNSFLLVGQGQPFLRYFYGNQKEKLAKLLCDPANGDMMYANGDMMYGRHIYFMDLAEFGCDVKYFNMVRYLTVYCFCIQLFPDEGPCRQIRFQIQL